MAFFRRVKKRLQGDDPQQLKRELQWLQTQVGRYKGKILAVGLLSLTGTIMGLISSVASKYLIDAVTGYGADMLWRAVAIMAVMLLGGLVLQGVSSRVGGSGNRYPIAAGTRGVFAYVPQGNSVFPGTIAENLRLVSPDATDGELEQALKIACAWDFVSQFPDGVNHRLGTGDGAFPKVRPSAWPSPGRCCAKRRFYCLTRPPPVRTWPRSGGFWTICAKAVFCAPAFW